MDDSYFRNEAEWGRRMLIAWGGAVCPYSPERFRAKWIPVRVKKTRQNKAKAMRALILALSILAIVDSAHFAKAGLSSTPRETLEPADTAIATSEATEETEEQIGLTNAKRRGVQRRLARLGFDTKVNGKFDESTRAAIARWQEEYGYPTTGFLNAAQHKALTGAAKQAGISDRKERRRAGGRARYSRGVGGPIGAIGGAVRGVGRGVGSAVGGLFRR